MVTGVGKVGQENGPRHKKLPNGMEGDAIQINGKTRVWHNNKGHNCWCWQDKVAGLVQVTRGTYQLTWLIRRVG